MGKMADFIANENATLPAPQGYNKSQIQDVIKIVEYIERNNGKINNHTWKVYKEQIESHIEDLKHLLSTLSPAPEQGDAVGFAEWIAVKIMERKIGHIPAEKSWRNWEAQEESGEPTFNTTTELYNVPYKQHLSQIK